MNFNDTEEHRSLELCYESIHNCERVQWISLLLSGAAAREPNTGYFPAQEPYTAGQGRIAKRGSLSH